MSEWSAGARSIPELTGNGWYEFYVTTASVGVVCGLNNDNTGVSVAEIEHAFFCESGQYRVVENGEAKTEKASFNNATKFAVVRYNGTIYYCVGSTPTAQPGVPFKLPGALVYTSTKQFTGTIFLDSALFMAGDAIVDAAIVTAPPNSGECNISFKPLEMIASNTSYELSLINFEPMTVSAGGAFNTHAYLSMLPPTLLAFEGNSACVLSFEPMTLLAESHDIVPVYTELNLVMEYPTLFASGRMHVDSGAAISFEPLVAFGSAGAYSLATLSFDEPTLFGTGYFTNGGPRINITLPTMLGYDLSSQIVETAIISDHTYPNELNNYRETAVLNDRATNIVTVARDLREKAKLNDDAVGTARTPVDVAETAVLNDTTTLYNYRTDVRETALLNDTASVGGVGGANIRDTAVLNDRAVNRIGVDVREVAVLNDATHAAGIEAVTVRDSAVLNDTVTLVVLGVETVRDSAVLNDVATPRVLALEIVVERGFISDAVYPPATDDAWTANMVTWSMSRYAGFSLNDFNERYALSEDGVFTHGSVADATFTTGASHLKSPTLKAVAALYGYGTHDEPLEIDVTADVSGDRQTYTYTQMARPNTTARVVRTDIGRGYYSNTYQLTVRGTGNFVVNSFEPVVGAGTRRI